jgi:hypothetical protein
MAIQIWEDALIVLDTINISCTSNLSKAVNDAPAVAVTGDSGLTVIPATSHGYTAGSQIYISNSTNYNGLRKITAVTTHTLTIIAPFVAETFSSAVMRFAYPCPTACELVGLKIHLSAAPTTSESLIITSDSIRGAAYDFNILDKPMNSVTDYLFAPTVPVYFNTGDLVIVLYANTTDAKTLGVDLTMRRIVKPGTRE